MKDVGHYSGPEIIKNLDEAMKNREASYSIFVVKYVESLPNSFGWFNEYDGNKLVCALSAERLEDEQLHEEIMCIALKWAKMKMLVETSKDEKINPVFIRERVSAVKEKLANLSAIRTQCGNIEEASGKVRAVTRTF